MKTDSSFLTFLIILIVVFTIHNIAIEIAWYNKSSIALIGWYSFINMILFCIYVLVVVIQIIKLLYHPYLNKLIVVIASVLLSALYIKITLFKLLFIVISLLTN